MSGGRYRLDLLFIWEISMLSPLSRWGSFLILLSVAALLSFVLAHAVWPLTLPPPWEDEIHFLIPAISFAHGDAFSGARMLTPQIYWMPSGYYILNGIIFFLSGHAGLHLARLISFVCVTGAALILRHVVAVALGALDERRPLLGTTLVLVWYLSLPVVFGADIARPDALALLTTLAALDCLLRSRLLGAFAFAALSVVVHPLLALPACAVAFCALPMLRPTSLKTLRVQWWEWLILVVAAGVVAVEIERLASDFAVYRAHWVFQLSRKAGRHAGAAVKLSAVVTLVAACWAFVSCWRSGAWMESKVPPQLPWRFVLVFGIAALFVHWTGKEMWYFPILLLGLLLVLCALLGSAPAERVTTLGAFAIPVSIVAVLAGLATWGVGLRAHGVYGFHVQPRVLARVATDLRAMTETTHDLLVHEDAKAVLVDPSLYYPYLGQHAETMPQVFTWNPLSRPAGIGFDHVVVLKAGYPSFASEFPAALLPGYACTAEKDLRTADGRYVIGITTVTRGTDAARAYVPCAS
jgi:hypothetical protein